MKLYLLDWGGTLNTLEDPVGFIESLKAAGHYTVLHSAWPPPEADASARACNDVWGKSTPTYEMVERIREIGPVNEVIIVDDESWCVEPRSRGFTDKGFKVKIVNIHDASLTAFRKEA